MEENYHKKQKTHEVKQELDESFEEMKRYAVLVSRGEMTVIAWKEYLKVYYKQRGNIFNYYLLCQDD